MTNDYYDLDYPTALCTPAQRAERLAHADRLAHTGAVERPARHGLNIYGTVGALIALTVLGFAVALCVATAATVVRP